MNIEEPDIMQQKTAAIYVAARGRTMEKKTDKKACELTKRRIEEDFTARATPLKEFSLISDVLREYFMNYTPDGMEILAQQRLHDLDTAGQRVMQYHLDFELETVDIDMDSDRPEEEKARLAQFYARNPLFAKAREDFQSASSALSAINGKAAFQVIGHVQETINNVVDTMRSKKQIEAMHRNPFLPPSPNGKTRIH